MGKTKKYYAVARGRTPGIYTSWNGSRGARVQVEGYRGARFKGFATRGEAEAFMRAPGPVTGSRRPRPRQPSAADELCTEVAIYTDGGAIDNPGPGGWGAVILDGTRRTELSGGFRRTTNNRMELTACIAALDYLAAPAAVALHSDSRYVVNGISKGWARRWRRNNWMRTRSEPALNADLWEKLLDLCDRHRVRFIWVKGHAGHPENERCDQLAGAAAARSGLPPDEAYENHVP
jgi:ribonuclease HI